MLNQFFFKVCGWKRNVSFLNFALSYNEMQGNSNMPVKTELLSGDQYFSFFLEENKFTNNKYHIFHCKSPLFFSQKNHWAYTRLGLICDFSLLYFRLQTINTGNVLHIIGKKRHSFYLRIVINIDYYMALFISYPLSALGHDIKSPLAG